jgi:hypothetical protein
MIRMPGRIFFILALAFTLFSFSPTFYEIGRKGDVKPEREFELVHNFYTDFNFYLSRIRQGLEGNLTVKEKYTSEPHQGSFIHVMYLALGWIGREVRVPWHRTADIYHVARFVLAMTLLLVIAVLTRKSFVKFSFQVTGFFLAVTASTYPIAVRMADGSYRYGGHMPWWSVMDSLQRITFIPHLLAGQALLAFLIYALANRETMRKPVNIVFLGILGFVLGIIFPPGLVFVVATAGMIVFLEFLYDFKNVFSKKPAVWLVNYAAPRAVTMVIGAPSLVYLSLMTSFFPWKQLALADIIRPLPFKYPEYLLAMGIVLPLGVLGMIVAFLKKDRNMIMPSAWVIAWAALLVIFNMIPQQSPLRFSEMIVHVPLGILAAYFFWRLSLTKWYRLKFRVKQAETAWTEFDHKNIYWFLKMKTGKILPSLAIFVLPGVWIISNLLHMHSSYWWQRDFVDHKLRASFPLVPTGSYVMYPLKDFVAAIRWIQDHTSRDTVILADTTAGNYIPVISGNTVYIGHDNTVNADEKKMFARAFFAGTMPVADAREWLAEENLHWVFWGPQEWEHGGGRDVTLQYPFLKEEFKNQWTRVFRVE